MLLALLLFHQGLLVESKWVSQPRCLDRWPLCYPQAHKKAIRRATVNTFGYIAKAIGPQVSRMDNILHLSLLALPCMPPVLDVSSNEGCDQPGLALSLSLPHLMPPVLCYSSHCYSSYPTVAHFSCPMSPKPLVLPSSQDVLVTLLNNLKVQERQNRVCTTVAIAIVAETCAPFTVLPALMNEYKVGPLGCCPVKVVWCVARLVPLYA